MEILDDENKEIEVITGDGSELDVSPVYDHLNALQPTTKDDDKKRNIIIPEVKEKKSNED